MVSSVSFGGEDPSMTDLNELIRNLESDDFLERAQAALALGERGREAEQAVPALISLLSREDARETARKIDYASPLQARSLGLAYGAAIKALGQIGAVAVPQLVAALKHPDPYVRTAVAAALGKIGPAAQDALIALAMSARYDGDQLVRATSATSIMQIRRKWWQFWKRKR